MEVSAVVFMQAGRASSEADLASVIICSVLLVVGLLLAFNFRGAAERFYDLTSSVTFGFVGSATPGLLRFVGAVIAALGAIGIIVETVVGWS